MQIIRGERIMKSFGEGIEKRNVLDDITIQINEGEFVSVMGPSGSGKSTLFYALSGMDTIDSGKVLFNHINLADVSDKELSEIRRKQMGFIFQQPTMLKNLNILDNIILPAVRDKQVSISKITAKAKALMEKTGIRMLANRDITQVSGGQLQRAGICRALINDPKIIFGDEPTGALNSKAAQEIMDILSDVNKEGTTVMLVTHDAKVAARTERVLFMKDGKLVSELQLPPFTGVDLGDRLEKITKKMLELGI